MKKKILTALKTRYKKHGFSDRAFNRVALYLEKTVKDDATDEDIDTAVEEVEDLLDGFQSELDARTAKYKADAEKWQASQTKDDDDDDTGSGDANDKNDGGKAKGKQTSTTTTPDEMPAWAKALVKQNEALTGRLEELSRGKVTDSRKLTLESKLKDAPEGDRKRILRAFDRMTFKDDEDFNAFVDETVEDLGEATTEQTTKGLGAAGAPLVGTGSVKSDKKAVDADIAAWAASSKPAKTADAAK